MYHCCFRTSPSPSASILHRFQLQPHTAVSFNLNTAELCLAKIQNSPSIGTMLSVSGYPFRRNAIPATCHAVILPKYCPLSLSYASGRCIPAAASLPNSHLFTLACTHRMSRMRFFCTRSFGTIRFRLFCPNEYIQNAQNADFLHMHLTTGCAGW
jgi:hypothetical protein